MVEKQPAPPRPTANPRTWWAAYQAAWRNPDGTKKRTPMPALVLLLVLSGVMVPLFLFGNSEDLARSASTTGVQSAGGETVRSSSGRGGSSETCRDAPVEFEVDGQRLSSTTPVSGECVPAGETETVTVRYDPDNPYDFTTLPRQWILYGFAGAAALGFLVSLVAVIRRVLARRRDRREAAPTGTLSS